MANIEKIIASLKNINKNNLSFEQGKIVIKLDKEVVFKNLTHINSNYHKHGANGNIYKGLLHPEDRLVRKNISLWIDELIERTKLISQNIHFSLNGLSELMNQSALVLSLSGKIKQAEILSRQHINYFKALSRKNFSALKYTIQPWINLGRIERIKGDFDKALDVFNKLKYLIHDQDIGFLDDSLREEELLEILHADKELVNVINTCVFLEPLKTRLSVKSYDDVLQLTNNVFHQKDIKLYGLAYEAAIIVHVSQGNFDTAFNLTEHALNDVAPQLMPVFYFRQAEIYSICGDLNEAKISFNRILDFILGMNQYHVEINKALFSVKLATQLSNFGFNDLSLSAYKKSLDFSRQLNDELMVIECLEGLISLGMKEYQAQLETLAGQNGYALINKRYKYCTDFQSLSMINEKSQNLFELLMNLNLN